MRLDGGLVLYYIQTTRFPHINGPQIVHYNSLISLIDICTKSDLLKPAAKHSTVISDFLSIAG